MTLPVIAIVGRPNVGKSTLFNRLTRSRRALVADHPGLTRDRHYALARLEERSVMLVDTGGLGEGAGGIDLEMEQQSRQAITEAQLVLLMLDARAGLTAGDEQLVDELRRQQTAVLLVMNKIDGLDEAQAASEFFGIGMGDPVPVSAAHGRGIGELIERVLELLGPEQADADPEVPADSDAVRIAIVGRPNVGKSTLVNRMLGEDRVVVYDQPGTTRDSIEVPFQRRNTDYVLIDTAGVRRRGRVHEAVEKFSVIKTLQAIEQAAVVVLMIDAQEGLVDQDLHLLGQIIDAGRALVLAVNKWDGLDAHQRDQMRRELDRRLEFVPYARQHFISALHGSGVGDLYRSVTEAHRAAGGSWSTSRLNDILADAVRAHQPPMAQGRRVKLRYAHQGGSFPPTIIIHGNQTERLPANYKRYLENAFRRALGLRGTPLALQFRTGDNPYAGRKNKLTDRQQRRRKRLIKHVKKK